MFDPLEKEKRIEELEKKTLSPGFWSNQQEASKIMREISMLKKEVESLEKLQDWLRDLEDMEVLAREDREWERELHKGIERFEKELKEKELSLLLNEKYDDYPALLFLHAGAGGTESCDWVEMLLRMYLRWGERRGYKTEILDLLPGEEAGLRSAVVSVEGDYAYGFLKAEKGVHRLVRISPFDANRRRHTSFALVEVLPQVEEEVEVEINPKDLKIETFRASGPGGQHVNVTDSAVRITHIPTGIVVQCQAERSQHQNKERAMKILKAKLFDYYQKKKKEELEKIKGEKKEIGWGNQIRSYILHPYNLVKDHRTGLEDPQPLKVLDGEIDHFIEAFLHWKKGKDAT
ncbi:peptide chain release factor 2 [Candidatus Calescamantes bacterium]|nr:peptide chain release factor 2 [Candidatus Calescamantes bacterium]